jgi:hypothetical protein
MRPFDNDSIFAVIDPIIHRIIPDLSTYLDNVYRKRRFIDISGELCKGNGVLLYISWFVLSLLYTKAKENRRRKETPP